MLGIEIAICFGGHVGPPIVEKIRFFMGIVEDDFYAIRRRELNLCLGAKDHGLQRPHLRALIRLELMKSPYGAIRDISCLMNDGVLTLKGSVPSYYFKQVAQRIALNVLPETATIINELEVEQ